MRIVLHNNQMLTKDFILFELYKSEYLYTMSLTKLSWNLKFCATFIFEKIDAEQVKYIKESQKTEQKNHDIYQMFMFYLSQIRNGNTFFWSATGVRPNRFAKQKDFYKRLCQFRLKIKHKLYNDIYSNKDIRSLRNPIYINQKLHSTQTFNYFIRLEEENIFFTKINNWIKICNKKEETYNFFLYKTILKELYKNFSEKAYINLVYKIEILEKNLNSLFSTHFLRCFALRFPFLTTSKLQKNKNAEEKNLLSMNNNSFEPKRPSNLTTKNIKLSIDKHFMLTHNKQTQQVKFQNNKHQYTETNFKEDFQNFEVYQSQIILFLESLSKSNWLLIESYFYNTQKFLYFNDTYYFDTYSYLLETPIFSSYSVFFYNFILSLLDKNSSNLFNFILTPFRETQEKNFRFTYGALGVCFLISKIYRSKKDRANKALFWSFDIKNYKVKKGKNAFFAKQKQVGFFKYKQILKNYLVLYCLDILYEQQTPLTNCLFKQYHSVYDCIEVFKQKFRKNFYFVLKIEDITVCVDSFGGKKILPNWLTSYFSFCFYAFIQKFDLSVDYIKNQGLSLMFSVFAEQKRDELKSETHISYFFKILFYICFFCKLEKLHSFSFYRENSMFLDLLKLSYKYQNDLVLSQDSLFFLTSKRNILINFLNNLKKQTNKFYLQIKKYKIVHSYFSMFNQKTGFEFKGFYLIQKVFLNTKTKKRIFFNINFNKIALPLWVRKYNTQKKNMSAFFFTKKQIYIVPSTRYLLTYLTQLKKIVNKSKADSQKTLIQKLKIQMNQWCDYYKIVSNKKSFYICDQMLFRWLWRWACRRHSNKSHYWIRNKYYHCLQKAGKFSKWRFCVFNKTLELFDCLPEHKQTNLVQHNLVKTYFSIYDENWKYWYSRN